MLTPTKQRVLKFINSYSDKKGYSPTLEEIRKGLKLSSISTIHQHVKELESSGHLQKKSHLHRSIEIPRNQTILLMGTISAGGPIEAIRDPRPIEVPRNMVSARAKYYALRIAGTSMIEDGIFDGDIIVVREQSDVDNGEKAVAYLPDQNTVTLKRIYREKNRVKLVPANKLMKPFYATNVQIQGKVVGVLRKEI
ncbi:MAG: repressor LexA [Candidatus Zambryskibacteria bacterium RIFCSPLOWO2_01_FULL_47_14]|uniref:Repressor LexA n=1 Tax=Candidatus Zambryskibacteria bacterium RIFCSPLOWO2_01_FULL_47_14 TaxID=1802763 RepID=A0A1G2U755_9BACT|nr:MAG: repressor LexA [Candidatus Zambryskibacteria bacterium RIFCSPLOWO2_01_FULL_47_14]